MSGTIAQSAETVVLVGAFNPAIIHPMWLGSQNLLPNSEAESARIEIVHPEVSAFATDWLNVQVTTQQFIAATTQEGYAPQLRDFVLGLFRLLSHTPAWMMGINRHVHLRMPTEDAWHTVGHTLAPKETWAGVLERPGTIAVTIRGARPDNFAGYIDARVEPSAIVPQGVFVLVNDHVQFPVSPGSNALPQLLTVLEDGWDAAHQRAEIIIERVRSLA